MALRPLLVLPAAKRMAGHLQCWQLVGHTCGV
jgi:hypothetical protein